MNHPIFKLLKVLLSGRTIQILGNTYGMSEDNRIILINSNVGSGYKIDCDISHLMKMAEQADQNELWLKCCEVELQKMNSKDRE